VPEGTKLKERFGSLSVEDAEARLRDASASQEWLAELRSLGTASALLGALEEAPRAVVDSLRADLGAEPVVRQMLATSPQGAAAIALRGAGAPEALVAQAREGKDGGAVIEGLRGEGLLDKVAARVRADLPDSAYSDWLRDHAPERAFEGTWDSRAVAVWRFVVRPIAVGGMLVGAAFTLFRMRRSLGAGLSRAFKDLRAREETARAGRTERYMSSKTVFGLIGLVFLGMAVLYVSLAGAKAGLTAAVVMLIAGFFFCTVSGYLVGMIGSSNNPISGLTLSTLIVAALLMVALGVSGTSGVVAVLGVAAVVCVAAAVAGELLQDFKVGWILGGTPRTIQIVELVAVVVAALVMYFPLLLLHNNNIKQGGTGFGDPKLSAPQASLMAFIAQGIVGGDMAWPLVIVGIAMGFAMVLLRVRSPMLVSVGMSLPFGTTAAIFVGGAIRWLMDALASRRRLNEAQVTRVTNVGILIASGLIAGEALMGLVTAALAGFDFDFGKYLVFAEPSYLAGVAVMGVLAFILIRVPLSKAGDPNEPAPPSAMM
ncbi:MAG TPA: oligopeptide transporter, OPT family, partial [Planctomycetota bacterium]|nr:oligopeptide transporter, OPT family [Planctomycetota bacterium]